MGGKWHTTLQASISIEPQAWQVLSEVPVQRVRVERLRVFGAHAVRERVRGRGEGHVGAELRPVLCATRVRYVRRTARVLQGQAEEGE